MPDSFHVCAAWLQHTALRAGIAVVPAARMWTRGKSGRVVEPGELIAGLPGVYGTAPAGRRPDPTVHGT